MNVCCWHDEVYHAIRSDFIFAKWAYFTGYALRGYLLVSFLDFNRDFIFSCNTIFFETISRFSKEIKTRDCGRILYTTSRWENKKCCVAPMLGDWLIFTCKSFFVVVFCVFVCFFFFFFQIRCFGEKSEKAPKFCSLDALQTKITNWFNWLKKMPHEDNTPWFFWVFCFFFLTLA